MILTDYHKKATGTEVLQAVHNIFEVNQWYSRDFIKKEILRIFGLFGITPKKAVTSHTILDFFIARESERKKVKGYYLIKKRTM